MQDLAVLGFQSPLPAGVGGGGDIVPIEEIKLQASKIKI
jgi:hypothetical protein